MRKHDCGVLHTLTVVSQPSQRCVTQVALGGSARERSQQRIAALAPVRWGVLQAVALGGLLVAGLALRVSALRASGEFSADEAIPGLMARHIAAGHELP